GGADEGVIAEDVVMGLLAVGPRDVKRRGRRRAAEREGGEDREQRQERETEASGAGGGAHGERVGAWRARRQDQALFACQPGSLAGPLSLLLATLPFLRKPPLALRVFAVLAAAPLVASAQPRPADPPPTPPPVNTAPPAASGAPSVGPPAPQPARATLGGT